MYYILRVGYFRAHDSFTTAISKSYASSLQIWVEFCFSTAEFPKFDLPSIDFEFGMGSYESNLGHLSACALVLLRNSGGGEIPV